MRAFHVALCHLQMTQIKESCELFIIRIHQAPDSECHRRMRGHSSSWASHWSDVDMTDQEAAARDHVEGASLLLLTFSRLLWALSNITKHIFCNYYLKEKHLIKERRIKAGIQNFFNRLQSLYKHPKKHLNVISMWLFNDLMFLCILHLLFYLIITFLGLIASVTPW